MSDKIVNKQMKANNSKIKKTSKIKLKNGTAEEKLDFSKLSPLCPICMSIYIEPVTLPCNHAFCMPCFQNNVKQTALACPLCRKRISIWVRRNSKTNTLINEPFWTWLKSNYKEKIDARLLGQDDSDDETLLQTSIRKVCNPGEIRQEYETQLEKMLEEQKQLKLQEEKASEQVILNLQKEEQQQKREAEKVNQELFLNDLQLARRLRDEQILEKIKSAKKCTPPSKVGPMDLYLSSNISPNLLRSDSEDVMHSTPTGEFSLSKKSFPANSPILKSNTGSRHLQDITGTGASVYSPVSEKDEDSGEVVSSFENININNVKNINSPKETTSVVRRKLIHNTIEPEKLSDDNDDDKENSPQVDLNESEEFDFIGDMSVLDDMEEQGDSVQSEMKSESFVKLHLSGDSSINSLSKQQSLIFPDGDVDENEFSRLVEEQRAIEAKFEQEKQDRNFALKLEKDMKKGLLVNRSKGSGDEYNLRQNDSSFQSPGQSRSGSSNSSRNKSVKKTPKRSLADADKLRQTTLLESLTKKPRML